MKSFLCLLPLAASALAVAPMANPEPAIQASGSPPPGCSPDYSGTFTISNTRLPSKRDLNKRTPPAEGPASTLILTLSGGILRDSSQRFGYIASNRQFQFDNPIQAGAVITEGWTACSNNTLALGDTTVFYQCISGNFYNLYDRPVRGGCIPINLAIVAEGSSSVVPASSYAASSAPASTYVAPTSTPAPVTTPASTPASTPAPPASTPAPPATSAPAATSSAPPAATYTGAAAPLAVEGSFFAMAAGAVALAMF